MTKEYIEKESALDSLCAACEVVPIEEKEPCPYRFTGCQEYANIFSIPAADVVEVVRCKDCAYRDGDGFCSGRGWPMLMVPADGYCDKGKLTKRGG